MKKIILFVSIIILFAFDIPGYVIRGTFRDVKEGMVYLKILEGKEWKILDSVVLRNGEFEFKGDPVAAVRTCYLELKDNNNFRQILFLENGVVTAKINTGTNETELTGTVNNEALGDYLLAARPINLEIKAILKEAKETWLGGDTTKADHYGKLFMDVQAKFPVLRNAYIEKYKHTDFGVYLLTEIASKSSITAPQVDSLMALVPADMQASPYYCVLKERLESVRLSDLNVMAPDLQLPDSKGQIVALSAMRGKYVLLDFWASWCGPCRGEIPNLKKNYEKYRADGFDIYSVSLDNNKEAWMKAVAETGMTWIQVSDLKGMRSPAAKLYAVGGIPATWLLDREGKIIAKNLRGEDLDAKLKEIFGH